MFSIMTLLFVVAIILWCFSTQARAQAQLETARPTVKQAIGKITTRREATGKPAPRGRRLVRLRCRGHHRR
ncbi:uncharacterized protein YpmS [Bradyrhizobium japonicum]|uniref:hypothetical protein n=1 Tax=Bradyrhizobium diazoefficiens TaxID=1355477 RepID=UPI00346B3463